MKRAVLLVALMGVVLISGCSRWSTPTEQMGKAYLSSLLNKAGGGNVIEFKKTNGAKEAEDYVLMYTAKVELTVIKDKTFSFAGKITFKNTENGWMAIKNYSDPERIPMQIMQFQW